MRASTLSVCAFIALSPNPSLRSTTAVKFFQPSATRIAIDSAIDAATRNAVIVAALKALDDGYVFPDVAAQMDRDIRARMLRGDYDSLRSAEQFANALTSDLRRTSHDKHIVVEWSKESIPERPNGPPGVRDTV